MIQRQKDSVDYRHGFHYWVLLIVSVLLLVATFLFTPKREIGTCVRTVSVGLGTKISLNCDSPSIVHSVLDTKFYLTENNPWRTRPVYIFSVKAGTFILSPISTAIFSIVENKIQKIMKKDTKRIFSGYLSAILFNFIVLFVTIFTILYLLKPETVPFRFGLAAFIATSDIVAGWLWVPHSIMMNLLVPVGGMMTFIVGASLRKISVGQAALVGMVISLASLTYGYCLIWILAFGLGAIYRLVCESEQPFFVSSDVVKLTTTALSFALPLVLWFGTYFALKMDVSYEAKLGQFTWLINAYQLGNLGPAMLERFHAFLSALTNHLGWWSVLIVVAFAFAMAHSFRVKKIARFLRDPVVMSAITTMMLMLLFNFLEGYYQPRLQMGVLIAGGALVARMFCLLERREVATLWVWALAALQLLMSFLSPAISQT